jgi:hypothetical protein
MTLREYIARTLSILNIEQAEDEDFEDALKYVVI